MIRKLLLAVLLTSAGTLSAAEFQGVIADWNCAQRMVQNGRENTLRHDNSCSLMKNYTRGAYALITQGKKYFRLDDPNNSKILQLLKDSPDKDNLHVVVNGDVQGGSLKVETISLL